MPSGAGGSCRFAVSARISAARAALSDNGSRQDIIRTVPRRGFRFLPGWNRRTPLRSHPSPLLPRQSIRFCRSSAVTTPAPPPGRVDRSCAQATGSRIWSMTGAVPSGDRSSTRWAKFQPRSLRPAGQRAIRLEAEVILLESCVADLEAVADAAGLDRFTLFGTSQGAPIAVAYAARHPERVERLILLGGYARGRLARASVAEREEGEAIITLIRHGWGKPGSQFIRAFSSMFIPNATPEQVSSLTELQRLTTSAENAVTIRTAVDGFDVSSLLERVVAPTLVMHARNDSIQPLAQGRELALGIRGAEFVMFEGDNHVILPHEPAWKEFFGRSGGLR